MSEEQVRAVILATLRALADELGREAAEAAEEEDEEDEDKLFCEACAMEMLLRMDKADWVGGLAVRISENMKGPS